MVPTRLRPVAPCSDDGELSSYSDLLPCTIRRWIGSCRRASEDAFLSGYSSAPCGSPSGSFPVRSPWRFLSDRWSGSARGEAPYLRKTQQSSPATVRRPLRPARHTCNTLSGSGYDTAVSWNSTRRIRARDAGRELQRTLGGPSGFSQFCSFFVLAYASQECNRRYTYESRYA